MSTEQSAAMEDLLRIEILAGLSSLGSVATAMEQAIMEAYKDHPMQWVYIGGAATQLQIAICNINSKIVDMLRLQESKLHETE